MQGKVYITAGLYTPAPRLARLLWATKVRVCTEPTLIVCLMWKRHRLYTAAARGRVCDDREPGLFLSFLGIQMWVLLEGR